MASRTCLSSRTIVRVLLIAVLSVVLLATGATAAFASNPRVVVRVEGSQRTLFNGAVYAGRTNIVDSGGGSHWMSGNAMAALDPAAQLGAFPYIVQDSSLGLYISSINAELPVSSPPYPGWLFRVNGVRPNVGADQVKLKTGDNVLYFYGTWNESPTVAVVPRWTIVTGASTTVVAEQLDANGNASPLPGAAVYVGSRVATSNAQGRVTLPMPKAGDFGVRVEKDGYVRSAPARIHVRYATYMSRLKASKTWLRRRRTRVRLSGRLTVHGASAWGCRATLMYREKGMPYYKVLAHQKLHSHGKFSFSVRPRKSTYYKAVFVGDSLRAASSGRSRLVTVR